MHLLTLKLKTVLVRDSNCDHVSETKSQRRLRNLLQLNTALYSQARIRTLGSGFSFLPSTHNTSVGNTGPLEKFKNRRETIRTEGWKISLGNNVERKKSSLFSYSLPPFPPPTLCWSCLSSRDSKQHMSI